jgi:hypothetical protein
MRSPLRLNAIEQEHLQELYDAAGVARDELPYTEQFDQLCREFEDRTFKHAEADRVYVSLLKYVRSSTCKSSEVSSPVEGEHMPDLQAVLVRYGVGGKLAPYSAEFQAAIREFSSRTGREWTARSFWLAVCATTRARRARGPKIPPGELPKSRKRKDLPRPEAALG